jgi:hypothetical protein
VQNVSAAAAAAPDGSVQPMRRWRPWEDSGFVIVSSEPNISAPPGYATWTSGAVINTGPINTSRTLSASPSQNRLSTGPNTPRPPSTGPITASAGSSTGRRTSAGLSTTGRQFAGPTITNTTRPPSAGPSTTCPLSAGPSTSHAQSICGGACNHTGCISSTSRTGAANNTESRKVSDNLSIICEWNLLL